MELRKHIDGRGRAVIFAYFLLMLIYLAVGFFPAPAEAVNYEISSKINIPSINLKSDVTALKLHDGNLDTPESIVGSFSRAENKIFLVGHSNTVFQNLGELKIGDEIVYDYTTFIVRKAEILAKTDISMNELLEATPVETLVIMTCAGEPLANGDATHRLIITATVR